MASTERADEAALITGGSRGIGYELAKLCARDGYDLVLVARQRERLQKVANQLASKCEGTTLPISKDLSRPESAQEVFDEVEREDVQIDILVNNAAARPTPDRFDETDLESTSDLLQINVTTLPYQTFRCADGCPWCWSNTQCVFRGWRNSRSDIWGVRSDQRVLDFLPALKGEDSPRQPAPRRLRWEFQVRPPTRAGGARPPLLLSSPHSSPSFPPGFLQGVDGFGGT